MFTVDYTLALILVLGLFVARVVGMAFAGIQFLWISLFRIRPGRAKPQGMLMATAV